MIDLKIIYYPHQKNPLTGGYFLVQRTRQYERSEYLSEREC